MCVCVFVVRIYVIPYVSPNSELHSIAMKRIFYQVNDEIVWNIFSHLNGNVNITTAICAHNVSLQRNEKQKKIMK